MQIALNPVSILDLPLPNNLDITNIRQLDPVYLQRRSVRLADQCRMFQEVLNCFAECQHSTFRYLRSFTLEVRFHREKHPNPLLDVMKGCGLTLRIVISTENLSLGPKETKDCPLSEERRRSFAEMLSLEPVRRMLAPLVKLSGVKSVEIHRRQVHCKAIFSTSNDPHVPFAMG